MKEFRLVAKLRNNRLMELRESLGLTTVQLAEKAGISYAIYIKLENMDPRAPIWGKRGKFGKPRWLSGPLALEKFYKFPASYLFPDAIKEITKVRSERRFNAEEMFTAINGPAILAAGDPESAVASNELRERVREVLATLTDRQRRVIEMRFGLGDNDSDHTISEVAEMLENEMPSSRRKKGVSRHRIHQIEAKALRILRHPSISKRLRPFLTDEPNPILPRSTAIAETRRANVVRGSFFTDPVVDAWLRFCEAWTWIAISAVAVVKCVDRSDAQGIVEGMSIPCPDCNSPPFIACLYHRRMEFYLEDTPRIRLPLCDVRHACGLERIGCSS